jgi:hypothetical protein
MARPHQLGTRREIRISSADVDRISAVATRIGELIGRGVPLTIIGPAYTYTQLAGKRLDILDKATSEVRERALAIASEAGAHKRHLPGGLSA